MHVRDAVFLHSLSQILILILLTVDSNSPSSK